MPVSIAEVRALPSDSGWLDVGDTVTFTVFAFEAITDVDGSPRLVLSNGAIATYSGLDGTGNAEFVYTIAHGEDEIDLSVVSLDLNGGSLNSAADTVDPATLATATGLDTGLDIDTLAPDAPVILPSNGTVIRGTAEPGSAVLVYDLAAVFPEETVTADASGNWTFTPASPWAHNTQIRAVSEDAAGHVSSTTNGVVDAVAPTAPVVIAPANGATTNDTTPTVTGTAEANSNVTVYIDGSVHGITNADGSGNWTYTPGTPLTDGPHTFRATAADAAGNTSVNSNTNTSTINSTGDVTPPPAPVVVSPADDELINDATPTITGTAEANSTVTVYVDGAEHGTTTANGSGDWTYTPGTALAEGPHEFRATATDVAGNISVNSNTNTSTIDSIAPAAPVVSSPADAASTHDSTPTVTGTAEAGSLVTVYVDSASVGTVTANGSGNWTYTLSSPLAEGSHTFQATAADTAGNISASSSINTSIVDTAPPDTSFGSTPGSLTNATSANFTFSGADGTGSGVASYEYRLDEGVWTAATGASQSVSGLGEGAHTFEVRAIDAAGNADAGPASYSWTVDLTPPAPPVVTTPASGSAISDNTPTVTGTAAIGSTVTVHVDGTAYGPVAVDVDGHWTFTVPTLADGLHSFHATATDAAGNVSGNSNSSSATVDTVAPETSLGTTPGSATSSTSADFTFSGIEVGGSGVASYEYSFDGGAWTAATGASQSFSGLAEGTYTFAVRAIDAAGNVDSTPASHTWTVDATVPEAPVVTSPANGTETSDTTPTITGTAAIGSTVTVHVGGTAYGPVTVDVSGNWTFTVPTLADGTYSFHATATDGAGNVSGNSNFSSTTVDTTAPETLLISTPPSLTNATSATFTYSGDDGAGTGVRGYVYSLDGGDWIATTGTSQSFSGLGEGAHSFEVRAVDDLGNVGATSASYTWTVDTTGPETSLGTTPALLTNSRSADFRFSGTDGSGVASYEYKLDGSAWVAAAGTSQSLVGLGDGEHTFQVRALDAAGNRDTTPASYTWTVDTEAPAVPEVDALPHIINDNRPTVSGTADPLTTVTIFANGVSVGTTIADANGLWSLELATELEDGGYTFQARATDAAGNVSEPTGLVPTTIDTAAPDAPVVTTPTGGTTTADATPTVAGTAEAGSIVRVYVDGTSVGTVTASISGQWSLEVPSALTNGAHTFRATATDVAGNASALSEIVSATVDRAGPVVTSVTASGPGVSAGTGKLTLGQTATLTVALSEAVNLSGAAGLKLKLSDGGTASLDVGASSATSLVFKHTIAAGQISSDLAVTGYILNGADLKDALGNPADLSGAVINPAGILKIDGNAGAGGAQTITGTKGADTMAGGGGNDTYVINHAGDKVVELAGGGKDLLQSILSVKLPSNVENITLLGMQNINATGNGSGNIIIGNSGDNILKLGAGNDSGFGGAGKDTAIGGAGKDKIDTGSGNDKADGGSGNDTIKGGAGTDGLRGGDGNDVLYGGPGRDFLWGGAGRDHFVFDTAPSSANADTIIDFRPAEDTIRLDSDVFRALGAGKLDVDAFKVIGTLREVVDQDDRIVYVKSTGSLYYAAEGDKGGLKLIATFVNEPHLTAADILVV